MEQLLDALFARWLGLKKGEQWSNNQRPIEQFLRDLGQVFGGRIDYVAVDNDGRFTISWGGPGLEGQLTPTLQNLNEFGTKVIGWDLDSATLRGLWRDACREVAGGID